MTQGPSRAPTASLVEILVRISVCVLLIAIAALIALRAFPACTANCTPGDYRGRPDLMLDEADRLFVAAKANASPQVLAFARAALIGEPLAARPLAYGGWLKLQEGSNDQADALFAAALERQPRLRLAHLRRVDDALADARYNEAVDALDRLMTLDRRRAVLYQDILFQIAERREGYDAVYDMLAQSPYWADAFIRRLNQDHRDAAFLFRINRLSAEGQAAGLARLVNAGDYERAFLAWQLSLPPDAPTASLPYDGAFKGASGAAPFNWSLHREYADYVEDGGLYAVFPGRGRLILASQTLLLSPSRYQATATMSGRTEPRGSSFSWLLVCKATGRLLGDVQVAALAETPEAFVFNAETHEDCPVQELRLMGEAGEFPLWARATTHSVTLDKLAEDE